VDETCGIDLVKLARVRSSSESTYNFLHHYLTEICGHKLPLVSGSFSSSAMCPGFVFVPIGGSTGNYPQDVPSQLISTDSEHSIPWGQPVGTKGGSFINQLSSYRLPTLDEIIAMFAKRNHNKHEDSNLF
jgi:hypothetical protein